MARRNEDNLGLCKMRSSIGTSQSTEVGMLYVRLCGDGDPTTWFVGKTKSKKKGVAARSIRYRLRMRFISLSITSNIGTISTDNQLDSATDHRLL